MAVARVRTPLIRLIAVNLLGGSILGALLASAFLIFDLSDMRMLIFASDDSIMLLAATDDDHDFRGRGARRPVIAPNADLGALDPESKSIKPSW